ncbi:bacterial conjugation TrbI-like family protein [Rickettsia hoogstraalii str. RCCE3]|nr:bacterial conjugation TrbI-like family protein [Rickettsia hoogstraalii str. RCCE3]
MQNHLEKLIENKYLETKTKIDDFSQKLESLEKPHEETILYDGNDFNNNPKIEDLLDNNFEQSIVAAPTAPVKRLLGYVKRADLRIKKDVKDYITTGSFARGVLLTGVVVGTGTNNAASPDPIMIRLVDTAIFSKEYKTEQIKEAILIGSCSGDISSERAKCRLETVSLLNSHGKIIEKPVEGWLIGEDGRPGIKG